MQLWQGTASRRHDPPKPPPPPAMYCAPSARRAWRVVFHSSPPRRPLRAAFHRDYRLHASGPPPFPPGGAQEAFFFPSTRMGSWATDTLSGGSWRGEQTRRCARMTSPRMYPQPSMPCVRDCRYCPTFWVLQRGPNLFVPAACLWGQYHGELGLGCFFPPHHYHPRQRQPKHGCTCVHASTTYMPQARTCVGEARDARASPSLPGHGCDCCTHVGTEPGRFDTRSHAHTRTHAPTRQNTMAVPERTCVPASQEPGPVRRA